MYGLAVGINKSDMKIEELIKGRWYTCNWDWNSGKPLTFLVHYISEDKLNVFTTRYITPSSKNNSGGFLFKELSNIRPCYSPELQEIIDREMPIDRSYKESIAMAENLSPEHQSEIEGDTTEDKARTLLLEEAKRRFPMGSKYRSPFNTITLVDFDFVWQNSDCISRFSKGLVYGKLSGWATLVDDRKSAPKPDDLSFLDEPAQSVRNNFTDDITTDQYKVGYPTVSDIVDFKLQYPRTEKESFKSDITIIRPSKRKTLSTDIPSTSAIKESIKSNK